ncbi:TldD/PmbA family protein [bacterium]|nr:TldD/PmbA family protein [candidate division CSSED10-310 bacterium]
MERIIALAKKRAQKAEVFRIQKEASPACFLGGKLNALEGENSISTGLRVISNGRLGFSSTTHPREIDGLVDRAIESARFGPETDLAFPSLIRNAGKCGCYDAKVEKLTLQDIIATGEEMVDIVTRAFPDVNIEAEVSRELHQVSIMNSEGGHVSYEKTIHQSFLNVLLMLPSDRAELEDTRTTTHLTDAPKKMADMAVWRFRHCHRVAPVKTGKTTVVFTSLGFRGLFVPLFYGLNGELAHRKLSLMTDRIGENVVHPFITLADDPTMPGLPGSCPFDDEGVPTSRKILIDRGVLRGYFYDLDTGCKAGVGSTGNGFKKSSLYTGFSIDSLPSPWPSSFVMSPGNLSRDEIIRSIDDGIIVDDLMGAGQGNNLNGEFSMSIALGYKIEKGEIVGRVKDVMVAGNVFDILKNNVRCLSQELYPEDTLFGRYAVPWIAFDAMPVAAT